MREKGILKIKQSKRHEVKIGKSEIRLPEVFHYVDFSVGSYECEVERVDGAISKLFVDGKEIMPNQELIQEKKVKEDAKKQQKRFETEFEAMKAKHKDWNDSFCLENAEIPKDTRNTIVEDIDNFNLKFNKFARFENDDKGGKFHFFKTDRTNIVFSIKPNFGNFPFEKNIKNQEDLITIFIGNKNQIIHKKLETNYRFITGLGGHSVYEVAMTLHHIYGIPYIPSSSVKGVIRSWVIYSQFENKEEKAEENSEFVSLFGSQDRVGGLIFFDAFPTSSPIIETDVMNPHYPKYYNSEGKEAPTDDQSPIPVFFLTVKNTIFQFSVASKSINLNESSFLGKKVEDWLKEALSEHGIGAKTAVGYGRFG